MEEIRYYFVGVMAFRRSLLARAKLFHQQQQHRFSPSFSHISSRDCEEQPPKTRNPQFPISRSYGSNPLLSGAYVTRNFTKSEIPMARYGLISRRNFSNLPLDGAAAAAAAPVVNEVAVAAADSFFPVAAFEHLIDYVHCYTGLEWWASIAAAALLIRFIHFPTFIFGPKFVAFILPNHPALMEILRTMDREKMGAFIHKIDNQFSYPSLQLFGYLVQYVNALFLFFAISNMVEKVPSFTTGGTLWFTDLTAPESMYLPILWSLTYCFRLHLDPRIRQLGGQISFKRMPLQVTLFGCGAVYAGLPAAIYCYGITSNLFFIAFGRLLMYPQVRELLEIPAILERTR